MQGNGAGGILAGVMTSSSGIRRTRSIANRIACAAAGAALSLAPWSGHADGNPGKVVFSDSEIQAILSHGPWPMRVPKDPSNRASGKYDAIEFGKHLFFDQR